MNFAELCKFLKPNETLAISNSIRWKGYKISLLDETSHRSTTYIITYEELAYMQDDAETMAKHILSTLRNRLEV